jgi:hypothetical protein
MKTGGKSFDDQFFEETMNSKKIGSTKSKA